MWSRHQLLASGADDPRVAACRILQEQTTCVTLFDSSGRKVIHKVRDLDSDLAASMSQAHRPDGPSLYRNEALRFGGLGTAVSVLHRNSEEWHRDTCASSSQPSVIFCTKPAKLYVRLPSDRAAVILMEVGDAVGIVSSAYEHKVEEDRARSSMWPGPFLVFTTWKWQ